jgi:hypothetical protein
MLVARHRALRRDGGSEPVQHVSDVSGARASTTRETRSVEATLCQGQRAIIHRRVCPLAPPEWSCDNAGP